MAIVQQSDSFSVSSLCRLSVGIKLNEQTVTRATTIYYQCRWWETGVNISRSSHATLQRFPGNNVLLTASLLQRVKMSIWALQKFGPFTWKSEQKCVSLQGKNSLIKFNWLKKNKCESASVWVFLNSIESWLCTVSGTVEITCGHREMVSLFFSPRTFLLALLKSRRLWGSPPESLQTIL